MDKLLGCYLKIEVPLLVYEYIPNGTLFEHIHDQNEEFPITWKMRLQIATEVAGALSYLHSVAFIPIYHQDIKSTNILLDEHFLIAPMCRHQTNFGVLDSFPTYHHAIYFYAKDD